MTPNISGDDDVILFKVSCPSGTLRRRESSLTLRHADLESTQHLGEATVIIIIYVCLLFKNPVQVCWGYMLSNKPGEKKIQGGLFPFMSPVSTLVLHHLTPGPVETSGDLSIRTVISAGAHLALNLLGKHLLSICCVSGIALHAKRVIKIRYFSCLQGVYSLGQNIFLQIAMNPDRGTLLWCGNDWD